MSETCNAEKCFIGARLEQQFEELRKTNGQTHEKLWNAINELKTNDAVQDSKYETILSKLNEVTMEVKALQEIPGNNWKDMTRTIISSITALIVGFILAKVGIF